MKVSCSVVVFALVFHFFLVTGSRSPPPSDSVIIIGAGMSGIMAAKTLEEAGYKDYIILEADSRIGGRVHKGQVDGNTVEMGANWLFSGGPKSSPAHEIAKKIKLRTLYSDYGNLSSNIYKQGGGLYEKHVVESAFKVADARQEFGTNLSKILSSKKGGDDDISILGSQRLFKQVPKGPLDLAVDYFYNDFEEAEPTRISSLKNTFPRQLMEDFGEDSYFVADPRGFETVVHYIANQFLSHNNNKITDPRLQLKKHLENELPGENMIFVTVTDEESRRIEQQSEKKTKAEIMQVLKKMFGNGKQIPEPDTMLIPKWWSNRLYKGSYSNWPNGYTLHSYHDLQQPFGRIYFAGEHTNSTYLGYVDGAYFSGTFRSPSDSLYPLLGRAT
ncbi:polyamine oxidase 1 [Citrus sinensis]|uniref:Polyamine oxidase 1 n=1 Tax=Citrus sinensis TaxID=2711 RepID=A0ACB8L703_CITSI|nr:polyamine oxidase 1 [Citrus sinensis]